MHFPASYFNLFNIYLQINKHYYVFQIISKRREIKRPIENMRTLK